MSSRELWFAIILVLAVVFIFDKPASSQQSAASPGEQALGQKLMHEIQFGLSCSTALITTQADLAKAQARIKELEPKPDARK